MVTGKEQFNYLLSEFTKRYIDILSSHSADDRERTYGFEYEFLPKTPMSSEDLEILFQFLISKGMIQNGNESVTDQNIRICFEPGGQIEYLSPPMTKNDSAVFSSLMTYIDSINDSIFKELGIKYIGTGFLPGRKNAPLCLNSSRYILLHERLSRAGTRGLEMMKGTASIHLHVIISRLDKLVPLFYQLCKLSTDDDFKMSSERRDIWNNTDPTRCGLPPCCQVELDTPDDLIKNLIHFALQAEVLGEDTAFWRVLNQSFDAFLYHMTTLFTDVRFNLKGPTLELRTLDSMPTDQFHDKWKLFISHIEDF